MTSDAIKLLFNRLGIEYLESNSYHPEALGRPDVKRSLYYRRNRREFDRLTAKYSGALGSPQGLPELEARHLGGALGYGLFTLTPLNPGDLIGEYTGIVKRAAPGRSLPQGGYTSDYSWGFPKVHTFGRLLEIDARIAGGLLRFANHPSGEAGEATADPDHFPIDGQWHVVFTAKSSIEEGGEITVDYGDAYWSGGERELL